MEKETQSKIKEKKINKYIILITVKCHKNMVEVTLVITLRVCKNWKSMNTT